VRPRVRGFLTASFRFRLFPLSPIDFAGPESLPFLSVYQYRLQIVIAFCSGGPRPRPGLAEAGYIQRRQNSREGCKNDYRGYNP
jgi:hypothetical protein